MTAYVAEQIAEMRREIESLREDNRYAEILIGQARARLRELPDGPDYEWRLRADLTEILRG